MTKYDYEQLAGLLRNKLMDSEATLDFQKEWYRRGFTVAVDQMCKAMKVDNVKFREAQFKTAIYGPSDESE